MTNPTHFSRRRLIQAGAAASAALGAPGLLLHKRVPSKSV
ncbi:MAG: twin-arginine translocation signal domain-containing protein [Betaproteobacteria bacterium]|nr:twin-arginine translocation signal domain-containing protein [Betaproteobacteria bacterium]